MVKISSVILMALGALIILVAVIPSFYITIPGTEKVGKQPLLIAGVTLIIIGALLMKSKTKQKSTEVPIFHGQSQQVVGYRRQAG